MLSCGVLSGSHRAPSNSGWVCIGWWRGICTSGDPDGWHLGLWYTCALLGHSGSRSRLTFEFEVFDEHGGRSHCARDNMLSPNDIKPKGYTPSLWSTDSGYGSHTMDDEEVRSWDGFASGSRFIADGQQQLGQPGLSISSTTTTPHPAPIGLGITLPQHASTTTSSTDHRQGTQVEDRLQLGRQQLPAQPVTTCIHVFPAKSSDIIPSHNAKANCVACQLWTFTNPGDGIKCNDCRQRTCIEPRSRRTTQDRPIKFAVPRLEIPKEPQSVVRSPLSSPLAQNFRASAYTPWSSNTRYLSPISPASPSDVRRSCARRPGKLPPHAVRHLRAWLKENRLDPYPNPDTKRMLAETCGISEKQVTTWFTNTRARKLALPSDRTYGSSDEDCHYDDSDLSSANTTPVCLSNSTFANGFAPGLLPQTTIAFTSFVPAPTPAPLPASGPVSRRGKKKDYRRMNNVSPTDQSAVVPTPTTPSPLRNGTEQEMWQCTFCLQSLVPKSWRRHEETQHLPKHQWTCLASHPSIPMTSRNGTSYTICAFCHIKNPDDNHLLTAHRILECRKKNEADRTFGRPDHLRQHVKNFHKCSLLEIVRDRWRRESPGKKRNEPWTCGFCSVELRDWDTRETHIANHFKEGKTMAEWTGQTLATNTDRRRSSVDPTSVLSKQKRTFTSRRSSRQEPVPQEQVQPQQQQQPQQTMIQPYYEQQPNLQVQYDTTVRHDTPHYQPEIPQISLPNDTTSQAFTSNAYLNPVISPPSLPQYLDSTFNPIMNNDFLNYDFSSGSEASSMAIPATAQHQQYANLFSSPITTTAQQQFGNMYTSPIDMYPTGYANGGYGLDYSAFTNGGVFNAQQHQNGGSSADASGSANDGSGLDYQAQWR